MPFTRIHVLLIILISQDLLLALFLSTTRRGKPSSNRLLAGVLLTFAVLFAVVLAKDHGLAERVAGLDLIAILVLGPLIELQARSLMTAGFHLRAHDLRGFTPVVIGLLAATGLWPAGIPVYPISFLVLAFFLIRTLLYHRAYRERLKSTRASINSISLDWLRVSLWFMIAVTLLGMLQHFSERLASAALDESLTLATLLAFGVFLVVFLFKALNHPELFDGVEPEGPSRSTSSSSLPLQKLVQVQAVLSACMTEHALFREADLQLADLARESGFPDATVSEAIRRGLADNFFDFVNRHRVEHASKLLIDTDRPILSVMADSGFNSKSSFYAEFRRRTGVPPGAYRRQNRVRLSKSRTTRARP